MKQFFSNIKTSIQNSQLNKKVENQYTPEQRLEVIQTIIDKIIHGKGSLAQNQQQLERAISLAHPLKLKSAMHESHLYQQLEIILLLMIKNQEEQNKNPNEFYESLDALNPARFTIIAWKIEKLDAQVAKAKARGLSTQCQKLKNKMLELIKLDVKCSMRFERDKIVYIESVRKSLEKSRFRNFMLSGAVLTQILIILGFKGKKMNTWVKWSVMLFSGIIFSRMMLDN